MASLSQGARAQEIQAPEEFPMELSERILARLPFPEILKLRNLSTWAPIRSVFRSAVAEHSSTWKFYGPIILRLHSQEFLAYDEGLRTWTRFAFPGLLSRHCIRTRHGLCGVLFFWVEGRNDISVYNFVTEERKVLPKCHCMKIMGLHVMTVGSNGFRVVVMDMIVSGMLTCHEYQSGSTSWICHEFLMENSLTNYHCGSLVDRDGKLHLTFSLGADLKFFVCDMVENSIKSLPHPCVEISDSIICHGMLRCKDITVLIVRIAENEDASLLFKHCRRERLRLFTVDLAASPPIKEFCRGPPFDVINNRCTMYSSVGNRLYFCDPQNTMGEWLSYDIFQDQWTLLCRPPIRSLISTENILVKSAFEPGCNPFCPV